MQRVQGKRGHGWRSCRGGSPQESEDPAMRPPVRAWLYAGLFALLTWISRVPFLSRYLWHFDSGNMALGLYEFNLAKHQPHPPGYIIFMGVAKAFHFLLGDANLALVSASVLFSGIAVGLIYLFGKKFFGEKVGLWAGVFLALNPDFWLHGEVALVYSAGAFGGILVAFVSWFMVRYRASLRPMHAILVGLAIGLVGGLRQSDLFLLAPLWGYAFWRAGRENIAFLLWGALGMAVGIFAWSVPLYLLSPEGSPAGQLIGSARDTSLFFGAPLKNHLRMVILLCLFTLLALGPAGAILLLIPWKFRPTRATLGKDDIILLMLWVIPSVLFFALIHFTNPGHMFLFLGAIVIAEALVAAAFRSPWLPASLAVVSCAVFLGFVYPRFILRPDSARRSQIEMVSEHPEATLVIWSDNTVRKPAFRGEYHRFYSFYFPQRDFYLLAFRKDTRDIVRFRWTEKEYLARGSEPAAVIPGKELLFLFHSAGPDALDSLRAWFPDGSVLEKRGAIGYLAPVGEPRQFNYLNMKLEVKP
ncbi:MAG: hypothetical protein ACPL68_02415 [Candidatus Hydrothermia bacterium]